MATLARAPLVFEAHQHPKHLLPALFQPVNLLCATLGIATAIALPLRNPDALAWAQIQHPSKLSGYINPDTSRGTPKTLLAEKNIPSGINRVLQSVSTPDLNRTVVDTTADSPRTLLTELRLPAGTNRLLSSFAAPEPVRLIVNTATGTPRPLFFIPSPFSASPHYPPVRFWFQPQDSSFGMPKVLASENVPFGTAFQFQFQQMVPSRYSVMDMSESTSLSLIGSLTPVITGNAEWIIRARRRFRR